MSNIMNAFAPVRSRSILPNQPQEQQRSELWANIGSEVEFQNEKGETEIRFASAFGCALENVKLREARGDSEGAQLIAVGNAIYDQVMVIARNLKPGETVVYGERGGLQIQILRQKAKIQNAPTFALNLTPTGGTKTPVAA